jgi:hypothetical protein
MLALSVVVGFARTNYLGQWFYAPPITTLLHLHGSDFTACFVSFVSSGAISNPMAIHHSRARDPIRDAAYGDVKRPLRFRKN